MSLSQTMDVARTQELAWRVSHQLEGFAAIFAAVAALLIFTSDSRLASGPLPRTGWALVIVFSLPLFLLFTVESIVVANVAQAGDTSAFAQWYGGLVLGTLVTSFPLFFLGVLLIIVNELRVSSPSIPRWASGIGAVGAVLSMMAPSAPVLEVPVLAVLWAGPLVANLWFLGLGVGLLRDKGADEASS